MATLRSRSRLPRALARPRQGHLQRQRGRDARRRRSAARRRRRPCRAARRARRRRPRPARRRPAPGPARRRPPPAPGAARWRRPSGRPGSWSARSTISADSTSTMSPLTSPESAAVTADAGAGGSGTRSGSATVSPARRSSSAGIAAAAACAAAATAAAMVSESDEGSVPKAVVMRRPSRRRGVGDDLGGQTAPVVAGERVANVTSLVVTCSGLSCACRSSRTSPTARRACPRRAPRAG